MLDTCLDVHIVLHTFVCYKHRFDVIFDIMIFLPLVESLRVVEALIIELRRDEVIQRLALYSHYFHLLGLFSPFLAERAVAVGHSVAECVRNGKTRATGRSGSAAWGFLPSPLSENSKKPSALVPVTFIPVVTV